MDAASGDATYDLLEYAMSTSAREIHQLNIRHYRKLLETETDPGRRQTIARLLRREEASLAELDRSLSNRKLPPPPTNPASGTD